MDRCVRNEVAHQRLWFEMKVLRQYYTIFVASLNHVRDVGYLIAFNTRRIASFGGHDDVHLHELSVRFFNSYLRAAINERDLRTAYYVMHHYRQLAEEALGKGDPARVVRIAEHLRFYGLLALIRE